MRHAAAKQTWDWLAQRYTEQHLTPDTRLQLDLGVDSLEWLNLTLEIRQHVGIELDEEAVSRIDTVRDLLREVTEAPELAPGHERLAPLEQQGQGDQRHERIVHALHGRVAQLVSTHQSARQNA